MAGNLTYVDQADPAAEGIMISSLAEPAADEDWLEAVEVDGHLMLRAVGTDEAAPVIQAGFKAAMS